MREAQPLFSRSTALKWLFAAGVVAIPFDAVRGIGALGELGNEASFFFFAAAIALALFVSLSMGESRITDSLALRVGAGMLVIILASYAFNAVDIHTMNFRERSGANKFATSLLVILYGIGLAWLAEQLDRERWSALLARAMVWSAAICSAYALFELLGRGGALGSLYSSVDALVHTRQADVINAWDGRVNEKLVYGWDPRLRSVSFEPPAFGNFTGFAWPWVWFAALKASPQRRLSTWAILILFTAIILISGSRTSLLMLLVNAATFSLLWGLYARPDSRTEAAAAARILAPVAIGLVAGLAAVSVVSNHQQLVQSVVLGDSVSNLSRLAFQTAGVNMFLANPLLGVGLGQFGFNVVEFLPSWAYRSPEIPPAIYFPTGPWPNVYSLYGRLAAELGVVGLIGWCALWLTLAGKLAAQARRHRLSGERVGVHYPVIMNCIGVLVSGIATDTFRTPMMWIALGLSCALLKTVLQPASGVTVLSQAHSG